MKICVNGEENRDRFKTGEKQKSLPFLNYLFTAIVTALGIPSMQLVRHTDFVAVALTVSLEIYVNTLGINTSNFTLIHFFIPKHYYIYGTLIICQYRAEHYFGYEFLFRTKTSKPSELMEINKLKSLSSHRGT